MASFGSEIINAVRDALIASGYTVFDSILDRHTGRATKSRDYVMIDRSITTDWTEQSQETMMGPFSLRLRFYQKAAKVRNSNPEMNATESACFQLEKDVSQVKTKNMFNRINIQRIPTMANALRGFTADFTITRTLSAAQDRSDL